MDRPRMFIPKLVSTAVGALWFIGLFSRTGPLSLYIVTTPFLMFLAIFVSVMLAAMVKQRDEQNLLKQAYHDAVGRWRELVFSTLAFIMLGFVLYVPFAAGVVLFYVYRSYLLLAIGAAASVLLLLALTFLVYFFPISLLEKGSVVEGFRDSASTSIGNSSEVVGLTLLSFVLLAAASTTGSHGMEMFGYVGFFVLRMVSGVVTTYIFVVSPEYYLSS